MLLEIELTVYVVKQDNAGQTVPYCRIRLPYNPLVPAAICFIVREQAKLD